MKIAINGFGRIGRIVARHLYTNPQYQKNLELVAVNDLSTAQELAFSMKYDSTHGKLPLPIEAGKDTITINGKTIKVLNEKDPLKLPWKQLGVDLVLECTGRYTDRESAAQHLQAGARKVIISAPAKGPDYTVVMGVNDKGLDIDKHHVLSNASCTTNCLAPIAHILHEKFQIKYGFMTTIHSYTSDQRLLDNIHSDPRRARTAAANIIPTTTGAAKAVGEVIPALKGKLDGFAVRVPTPNVSLTDFVAELGREVTAEEVNNALVAASQNELKGILGVSNEPLVSSDYNGDTRSSIIDLSCTKVTGSNGSAKGSMVKVYSWYDNETGFSCRLLELSSLIASKLK
jgi:glyceraldehyde 3-phosphate dehydrogenase